jgi:hypothetical protein
MIWLNPAALFALAAVAAPILIHILIQRRAERFPFPTLRFLQPTRLASVRRHLLEDLPLLAVRVALLAAAVAALAGPLLVTAARRQAWDRRVVRAIVRDDVGAEVAPPARADQGRPLREETFVAASLADGIRRATLWLGTAPPARREIVIASPFPLGSMTAADVAAVPADIGLRFERTGALPDARTTSAGRLLTAGGIRALEVTLAGDRTSVRDTPTGDATAWPIDVVTTSAEQPIVDAAVRAVLSQRVWAAPPDRHARLVVIALDAAQADLKVRTTPEAVRAMSGVVQAFRPAVADALSDASPIQLPWMADAAARIARDPDLRSAAARVTAGLTDPRFAAAPWQTLASAADGHPLAAAAASGARFVVASAAPPSDIATPVLLRSMANAIADAPDLRRAEVLPIADAVLRQWSRAPGPVAAPRIETVDRDDRRWLWLAALGLLAIETWIRRARPADVSQGREKAARVA